MVPNDDDRAQQEFNAAATRLVDFVFADLEDAGAIARAIWRDIETAGTPDAIADRMLATVYASTFIIRTAVDIAVTRGGVSREVVREVLERVIADEGWPDAPA